MRSIAYAGNDFSEIYSAEVVERAANPIVAEAMAVPGRAGALLVSGYIPPVDVRVRLFSCRCRTSRRVACCGRSQLPQY